MTRITAPPDDLPALAEAARAEGFRVIDVLAREWADGTMRFATPGEALFAARDAKGLLVGIGGITRDPFAEALRMRRFYVLSAARGTGIGRALAAEAIARARAAGVGLIRLRAPEGAWQFWEALGFEPFAGDEAVTHRMVLHEG